MGTYIFQCDRDISYGVDCTVIVVQASSLEKAIEKAEVLENKGTKPEYHHKIEIKQEGEFWGWKVKKLSPDGFICHVEWEE